MKIWIQMHVKCCHTSIWLRWFSWHSQAQLEGLVDKIQDVQSGGAGGPGKGKGKDGEWSALGEMAKLASKMNEDQIAFQVWWFVNLIWDQEQGAETQWDVVQRLCNVCKFEGGCRESGQNADKLKLENVVLISTVT